MSNAREIVRGSFWSYTGIVLMMITGLLTNLLLARTLGVENWGVFSLLLVIVSLLTALTDLGLNYFMIYTASSLSHKEPSVIRKALSAPLRYKAILILVIGLGIFIFANPLSTLFKITNGTNYFVASAVFFVIFNLFSMLNAVLFGLKKFRESTFLSTLYSVLQLAVAYGLVVLGFGVNGAIAGYIAAMVISTAIEIVLIRQYISFTGNTQESVVDMFTFGVYIGLGSLAATISLWTDSVMVGLFIGAAAVGIYRIAVSISTSVGSLVSGVNTVLFPFFTSAESRGEESMGDLNTAIKYGSFIAFPAMIGLALSGGAAVKILFGQQYAGSAVPLILLSYICFDAMFTGMISSYLGAKKKTKIVGVSAVASTIANVLLNLILIPFFGIIGAAVASVLTRLANAAIMVTWSSQSIKAKYNFNSMRIPIIGSILMGAFLLFAVKPFLDPASSPLSLILFMGAGMVSYAIFEQLLGFDIIIFAKKILNAMIY